MKVCFVCIDSLDDPLSRGSDNRIYEQGTLHFSCPPPGFLFGVWCNKKVIFKFDSGSVGSIADPNCTRNILFGHSNLTTGSVGSIADPIRTSKFRFKFTTGSRGSIADPICTGKI